MAFIIGKFYTHEELGVVQFCINNEGNEVFVTESNEEYDYDDVKWER
ncbi:MAG: hypothetical protein WBB28_14660 [Crinalium sp.]